jgi:hypothetical protein
MAEKFFPFKLEAQQMPTWVDSPRDFREVFQANRPKNKSCYGYDVKVLSATQVEFTAFGMADSYYGGIGEPIATFEVTVDPEVTRKSIVRRAGQFAFWRREAELVAQENAILMRYRDEILATLEAA